MPISRPQRTANWLVDAREISRRNKCPVRANFRQLDGRQKSAHERLHVQSQRDRGGLESQISQLHLDTDPWVLNQRASHICQARRRSGVSDDDDLDLDDDEDDDVPRRVSSRNSKNLDDDSDFDEEEEEDVEEDAGNAAVNDPTTRLFQMVKDRDYDDEEEETVDEDDDEGIQSIESTSEMKRRGRKRKTTYDQANRNEDLEGMEDEEDGIAAGSETEDLDAEGDEDVDLDAIMGSAFSGETEDGVEEEEPNRMPSRAAQQRALDSDVPLFEDDGLMEDDQLEPLMEYATPPKRRWLLGELLAECGFSPPDDKSHSVEITSIETDWEKVTSGSLYIPLPSPDFLDQYRAVGTAVDNGAAAILSIEDLRQDDNEPAEVPICVVPNLEEAASKLAVAFHDYPSSQMTVVGVTGSRGKTTTSWLIRGIFEEMQLITGMLGSLEYSIAVDKMTVDGSLWQAESEDPTLKRDSSTAFHVTPYTGKYECPPTTPDMVQVQKVMAGMADRGATACVYEADLEAVSDGWTRGVEMAIAIYMGFTKEEIEDAGGVDILLEGQKQFFGSLKDADTQTAVINMDDDYYHQIMEYAENVPAVTFSINDDTADVYVAKANFSIWDTSIVIQTPAGKLNITSALIGRHNLPNILAAVACGLALTIDGNGIPLKAIVNGISATEIVPGRCEVIDEEQEFGVVIDAANTPESLSRLLDSIREAGARKIFLVFGCEGGGDKEKRPFMGEIAHYKADTVIITNDNPRGERPNAIVADIVAGYPDEILALNAMQAYPPGFLQDPGRIQLEALEFSWQNCYEYRRYVMEDRWTAIRWAIGTAQRKDVVVLAGKGAQDYQEYIFDNELVKSWFDDRVECRNALSKVAALSKFDGDLDRKELPWMEPDERPDNLRVYNLAAD